MPAHPAAEVEHPAGDPRCGTPLDRGPVGPVGEVGSEVVHADQTVVALDDLEGRPALVVLPKSSAERVTDPRFLIRGGHDHAACQAPPSDANGFPGAARPVPTGVACLHRPRVYNQSCSLAYLAASCLVRLWVFCIALER